MLIGPMLVGPSLASEINGETANMPHKILVFISFLSILRLKLMGLKGSVSFMFSPQRGMARKIEMTPPLIPVCQYWLCKKHLGSGSWHANGKRQNGPAFDKDRAVLSG
jgi:hypothetical protein